MDGYACNPVEDVYNSIDIFSPKEKGYLLMIEHASGALY